MTGMQKHSAQTEGWQWQMEQAQSTAANALMNAAKAPIDREYLRSMDMKGYLAALFKRVESLTAGSPDLTGLLGKRPLAELLGDDKGSLFKWKPNIWTPRKTAPKMNPSRVVTFSHVRDRVPRYLPSA